MASSTQIEYGKLFSIILYMSLFHHTFSCFKSSKQIPILLLYLLFSVVDNKMCYFFNFYFLI